jgi:hypothetical protein
MAAEEVRRRVDLDSLTGWRWNEKDEMIRTELAEDNPAGLTLQVSGKSSRDNAYGSGPTLPNSPS